MESQTVSVDDLSETEEAPQSVETNPVVVSIITKDAAKSKQKRTPKRASVMIFEKEETDA